MLFAVDHDETAVLAVTTEATATKKTGQGPVSGHMADAMTISRSPDQFFLLAFSSAMPLINPFNDNGTLMARRWAS